MVTSEEIEAPESSFIADLADANEGFGGHIDDSRDDIEALLDAVEAAGDIVVEAVEAADDVTVSVEAKPDVEEDVTEEEIADIADNDADALLATIESEEKAAAAAAGPAPTTKTTKTPRAPKNPATPKVIIATREFSDVAMITKAEFDTATKDCAAKIAEKANNMIAAVTAGKRLSRFTAIAAQTLVADGKISSKSLIDAYTGVGLGLGTARAQSQQMTSLFKMAGLVIPDATSPRELMLHDTKFADELALMAA